MNSSPNEQYRDGDPYRFQLTLDHILRFPAGFCPEKEIVYRDIVRYDYRTLYERVNRLASALHSLGVRAGDVVGVMDWDSHRYLECLFAVPMLGAVLHTINVRLSPDQIVYTMNHARDKVVLTLSDFLPLLEGIADKLDTVESYVLMVDAPEKPATTLPLAAEYEEMLAVADAVYDFPELAEDTQATIFYTTGTTGLPKGVHFTHRQLVLHTLAEVVMLGSFAPIGGLRTDSVYMPLTPLFHVHAWGVPFTATLLGAKQVYPGRYEPEMILKLVLGEKVTFSHCVPAILNLLVSSPVAAQVDLSRWNVVIGGSALPRGLAEAARKLGINVFSGYGMSETGPMIAITNLKEKMFAWPEAQKIDYLTKAGFPAPFVMARIEDEGGGDASGDDVGELTLRAPWLTQSYWQDEERSRELWKGGWLHTGDVAYLDDEGYICLTDRLKDVIKSGGEWISSLELEDLFSQHEAVTEAAVIGIPDDKWGERPLALVVLKPEHLGGVTTRDLQDFLRESCDEGKISKWAVPERIEFIEAIPKTSVGKIDKRELRAQFCR